jgi:GNAT superfamily N-acetyltransferase
MTIPVHSDLELLEIQVEALFTHDAEGRIFVDNEPDGDPAPRFFFGRTREGNRWRVRHDVPEETARRLEELAETEPVRDDLEALPVHLDAMLEALRQDHDPVIGHHGPAYRFPEALPDLASVTRITLPNLALLRRMIPNLDGLARDFAWVEPWMAMVVDGVAVSTCFSSRLTDRAAEAGLDTLEGYRGRGYAPAVVAAWARAVRETGRIPLYSTSWGNLASQAVARKLGLIVYGSDLSIE